MEHRGWNRWQPVANRLGANVQNSTKTVAGIVTSCRKKHMVRRGRRFESVRWLSRKPRKRGGFQFFRPLHLFQRDQVWNT